MTILENPFDRLKANDLSDEQIMRYWVDIDPKGAKGLLSFVDIDDPTPTYLVGAKGTGKTHLLRYLELTARPRSGDAITIPVYVRCGGINAERFARSSSVLETFTSYMELWIAQLLLERVIHRVGASISVEGTDALPLIGDSQATLGHLLAVIQRSRLRFDRYANELSLDPSVQTPSVVVPFGALALRLPSLVLRALNVSGEFARIVYILDELENLNLEQQKYVNSCVRFRPSELVLRVGSRTHGLRTFDTLSGEKNVPNSEFRVVQLDQILRRSSGYKNFATGIVARRIEGTDSHKLGPISVRNLWSKPPDLTRRSLSTLTARPWLRRLDRVLRQSHVDSAVAAAIVEKVSDPHSFLEKVKTFLLIRRVAQREDPRVAADKVASFAFRSRVGHERDREVFNHFRSDIEAQFYSEIKEYVPYTGLDNFIRMSAGVPRHLLAILKHTHDWALFLGDVNYSASTPISTEAQVRGVLETAEWHMTDTRAFGPLVHGSKRFVARLADLMRTIRLSDKPSECSLCTFAMAREELSAPVDEVITAAEHLGFIVRVSDHKDKNSRRIFQQYQVHPLLAPRWSLPISRRGTLQISATDMSIIVEGDDSAFGRLVAARTASMNAPFEGDGAQLSLFDVGGVDG